MIGSPPHTWRILLILSAFAVRERITSTYVENTVRGSVGHASAAGSPPHTWRILHILDYEGRNIGITSTYVENTSWVKRQFQPHGDHLHIRGEYKNGSFFNSPAVGSPPHTWRILIVE